MAPNKSSWYVSLQQLPVPTPRLIHACVQYPAIPLQTSPCVQVEVSEDELRVATLPDASIPNVTFGLADDEDPFFLGACTYIPPHLTCIFPIFAMVHILGENVVCAVYDGMLGLAFDGCAKIADRSPVDWLFTSLDLDPIFSIHANTSGAGQSMLLLGGYGEPPPTATRCPRHHIQHSQCCVACR